MELNDVLRALYAKEIDSNRVTREGTDIIEYCQKHRIKFYIPLSTHPSILRKYVLESKIVVAHHENEYIRRVFRLYCHIGNEFDYYRQLGKEPIEFDTVAAYAKISKKDALDRSFLFRNGNFTGISGESSSLSNPSYIFQRENKPLKKGLIIRFNPMIELANFLTGRIVIKLSDG